MVPPWPSPAAGVQGDAATDAALGSPLGGWLAFGGSSVNSTVQWPHIEGAQGTAGLDHTQRAAIRLAWRCFKLRDVMHGALFGAPVIESTWKQRIKHIRRWISGWVRLNGGGHLTTVGSAGQTNWEPVLSQPLQCVTAVIAKQVHDHQVFCAFFDALPEGDRLRVDRIRGYLREQLCPSWGESPTIPNPNGRTIQARH